MYVSYLSLKCRIDFYKLDSLQHYYSLFVDIFKTELNVTKLKDIV